MQKIHIETLFESIRLSRLELAINVLSFEERQRIHADIRWAINELKILMNTY